MKQQEAQSGVSSRVVKSWDLWLRLFHWLLAFLVLFLIFSGLTGTGFFNWHKPAGEAVLALLLFRVAWGMLGSSNARLIPLFSGPGNVVSHLSGLADGKVGQYHGHNPAGGWAVLIMLLLLLVQAGTGLFIADEEEWVAGALHGNLSDSLTAILYEIHHLNATLLQLMVFLHVLMIPAYFFIAKQNLLKPMITGKKIWAGSDDNEVQEGVKHGAWWLALLLLALSAGLVAWVAGYF